MKPERLHTRDWKNEKIKTNITTAQLKSSTIWFASINLLQYCLFSATRSKQHDCYDICSGAGIENNKLTITCTINNFILPVFIYNARDTEIGYCQAPPFPECFKSSPDRPGKLTFNPSMNTTTYVLEFSNEKEVNGRWTCSHGSGKKDSKNSVVVYVKGMFVNILTYTYKL